MQKHDASHLHYDFRLELDGALKSWAVPKGPDLDPSQKRLAMQVEDHPLEYGDFEGTIPQGQYGGGTVMLWDRGTWEPLEDARRGYREGQLKFVLYGEKLQGGWMLVRRGGRKSTSGERHWFLFKERDEFADSHGSITEKKPLSVATGRNLEEIAVQADRVWGPNGEDGAPKKRTRKRQKGAGGTTKRKGSAATLKQAARSNGARRPSSNGETVAGVRLTHPDKLFYPEQGFTKRDLAEYYEHVAEWMLPLVANRPLALLRCPDGYGRPCFFQKHPSEGATKYLRKVNVSKTAVPEYHFVVTNTAGLVELVQMGVLEIHVWGARAKSLERPDRLVFDLDPDLAVDWVQVVKAAREVRLVLQELGLKTFLKTTGGKGLHLVVPIQPRTNWADAKAFCKSVADLIVQAAPDRYVATMSKKARKRKIFIDYLRNDRGATWVAPFSTRAKPGAPVSVPISWDELTPRLRSDHFTVANVLPRLAKLKQDPWAKLAETKQSITKAMFERLRLLKIQPDRSAGEES